MELATLHRLFPGRLLPGIGHGVQDWMAQVGARPASPLTLLREHAEALRRLLDGEEVTVSGRYVHLDRVRLDWPPGPGTPLFVGGTGPRTLELAGEVGDGILLGSELTEAQVADSVAAARVGWASDAAMPVVTHLLVTTRDARAVADAVRALAEIGVTTVVFQPTDDESDIEGFVEFVGRDVRAALAG